MGLGEIYIVVLVVTFLVAVADGGVALTRALAKGATPAPKGADWHPFLVAYGGLLAFVALGPLASLLCAGSLVMRFRRAEAPREPRALMLDRAAGRVGAMGVFLGAWRVGAVVLLVIGIALNGP